MSDNWKDELHSSFGLMGSSFALHPNDKKRANRVSELAKKQGIKYAEIIKEAERYLLANGNNPEKIQKVLFDVEDHFRNLDS